MVEALGTGFTMGTGCALLERKTAVHMWKQQSQGRREQGRQRRGKAGGQGEEGRGTMSDERLGR